MRYDEYKNRILKVARVLQWIRRHTVLLIIFLVAITGIIGAMLALRGTVLWNQYPDDMIYGDTPKPKAIAFLSPVSFEYRAENGDWSSKAPKLPGNYQVRSVGTTIIGKPRYGETDSFQISPKAIEVTVSGGQVVYGDTPNLSGNVAFGDRLVCDLFDFEDILQTETTVTPRQSSIRALSSKGEDVTRGYVITVVSTSVRILPRKITVTVEDTSQVYNGTSLSYDQYAITEGTLANNDTLQAVFYESITDVGSIPNTPQLCILTKNAQDITHHYQIKKVVGKLTVEHRPLIVSSESISKIYNGQEISNGNWVVSSNTPLVLGHKFRIESTASFTDVGIHENNGVFTVLDSSGKNKTHNYSIFVQKSTIEILPKSVLVTTPTQTWEYDGTEHQATSLSETGLVAGHTFKILEATSIKTVGTVSNTVRFAIYSGNVDVSKNYDIQTLSGTLTVTPRSIIVCPQDVLEYYFGTPISCTEAVIAPNSPRPLAEGQRLVITSPESLTNVGTITSTLSTVKVMHQNQDVTSNYVIETGTGSITVLARPIRIVVADAEKAYDATPLTSTTCTVLPVAPLTEALAKGHRIDQIVTDGTQTAVGSSQNCLISFAILDKDGVNQIKNYDVTVEHGKLTVTKRPIKIVVQSAEKVYDGTPLTANRYEVLPVAPLPYALVTGHRIDNVVIEGSQTDAGSSENRLTDFKISDENGINQIKNYDVTVEHGTLTVTKRPIKIVVQSAEKVYDGTPLTANGYTVLPVAPLPYALVAGHRVDNVVIEGSQTDAGSSENRLTDFEILDSYNREMTKNYDVAIEHGTLTVTKRPITVLSGSAEKMYDGMPLVCHDPILVTAGSLVPGHSLGLMATGKQTEVGTSDNFIEGDILDVKKTPVTANYEITFTLGTLRVYANNTPDPGDPEDIVLFQFVTESNEYVYFRLASYGDYMGKDNWTDAPAYSKLLDGIYSYQYLTAIALKNAGYEPIDIQLKTFTGIYPIPYHPAQGNYPYNVQTNDTVSIGPDFAEYALGYYPYQGNGSDLVGYLGSYSDEELEYRSFVYDQYLWVDDETKAFMQKIIESNNFDPNDPAIILKVAHYIKSAAKYDDTKSGQLDKEDNMIIAFLDEYKQGVCRHYAAAATALYRTLGIPARYTTGFAKQAVAGEWVEVGIIGHAWTEIYIDGVGWIPMEVTGSAGNMGGNGNNGGGNNPQKKGTLTLVPEYQYKIYDGTPLVATNQLEANTELAKLLEQGYSYEITIIGSQTEVGKGVSEITEFHLYDPRGKDVTDQYKIICEKGVLEVLEAETKLIHVYLYQLQKYYDGTELFFEPGDYEIEGLAPGHRLELTLHISLREVGSISLSQINKKKADYAEYQVFSGNIDVTDMYSLIFESPMGNSNLYVPIQIDPRPLELSANSVSKHDDGKPLEPQGAEITLGSLAPGHELLPVGVIGTQNGVGASECMVDLNSVVILDQNGNNVTANYDITTKSGILEIYDPYS